MGKDFNNIEKWLLPLLESRGITVEKFARSLKPKPLSRAAIYHYLKDTCRPSEPTMLSMCSALGVPFEEGLRQYTPKQNGRPKNPDKVRGKKD